MSKSKFLSFSQRWRYLIGTTEEFSMEARIFHSISIIIFVALIILTGYNLSTTLHLSALISAIIVVLQAFLYYISRFRGMLNLAASLSAIEINIGITFAYFYNSGISGSILLLFALTLFLIVVVIPKKQRLFWYLLNLAIMGTLVYLEYLDPGVIKQHYANRGEMFTDVVFTYIVVVTLLYICTVQLRRNYDEQKQLAEEKAGKLQLMNSQKDKLFSIISHDLTGPLASLKQYLSLLNDIELTPHERSVVERDLARSLGDAQYLLENLLHWTKSQMENDQMFLEKLTLRQVLGPTVLMFQQTALAKGVRFLTDIDELTVIRADRNMFQSVMRNLLNNAIKFTYAEGVVELKSEVSDGRCVLSVRDNGTGISPEKQAKIFTMNIVSSYGTELEKGTGLGLMLCKDFVDKQDGRIWFESTPESGTVFYVSMPVV
ncbi:sensor histidine kinase [Pedobacter sp. PWIIR3]